MIYPVLIGSSWDAGTKLTWPAFRDVCEGEGHEPEFVFIEESDARSEGVTRIPCIRIFDDADPYGEPLIEHVGAATGHKVRYLLDEAEKLSV